MNSEQELYARAVELAENGAGDAAVLFDLSAIAQIDEQGIARAVAEILDERFQHVPHEAYSLPRHRWMYLTDSESATAIDTQIKEFSAFLAQQGRGAIRHTSFDLKRNADEFREVCAAIAKEQSNGHAENKETKFEDLDRLIGFEARLKGADLSPFLRIRKIWRVERDGAAKEVAREVLVLKVKIEALLDISFTDGSWLAKHTAELFDRHLMHHLLRDYRLSRRRLPPFVVPLLPVSLEDPEVTASLIEMHGIALMESGAMAETVALGQRGGVGIAFRGNTAIPASLDPCIRFILSPEARSDLGDRLVLVDPDEGTFAAAIESGIKHFEGLEIPQWASALDGAEATPEAASPNRSIEDAAAELAQDDGARKQGLIGHLFGRRGSKT